MRLKKFSTAIAFRTRFSVRERKEAVAMWHDGFDTWDISQAFNTHESVLYNNLPKWRGKP